MTTVEQIPFDQCICEPDWKIPRPDCWASDHHNRTTRTDMDTPTADATIPTRIDGPTFPARVTLKAINIHHGLSEETYAYTASVYLDGKKVGTVKNHGRGGPDMLHIADADARAAVEATQREYYPEPYCEDVLFGEMLIEHLLLQDVKKAFRGGKYKFVVLAGDALYGFNEEANIEPQMVSEGVREYRVFTP